MPKLKNNSVKLDRPVAVARKNGKGLIALLVVVILGALIVVAQQGEPMPKKDISVTDRFENAIERRLHQHPLSKGKLCNHYECFKARLSPAFREAPRKRDPELDKNLRQIRLTASRS